MTDPVERLQVLRRYSDPRLEDFEGFLEAMQKMSADKDWKPSAAMQCMTDFLQGAHAPMRVYANRIIANWTAAEWLPLHNKNHCEMARSGLGFGLQSRIWPLIPQNDVFDRMDEIYNRAADSEAKPDGHKPQQQQPHQQQKQSRKSSQQGGTNHAFRSSITELASVTIPEKSNMGKHDKTLPRHRSPQSSVNHGSQRENAYAPVHLKDYTFRCTNYKRSNIPEIVALLGDRKQLKCHGSSNSQQEKMYLTSLGN